MYEEFNSSWPTSSAADSPNEYRESGHKDIQHSGQQR
jgi:hypothetical protein